MPDPLFDIKSGNDDAGKLEFSLSASSGPEDLVQVNARAKELIAQIRGELKPNTHIDFCTAGELYIHHLLSYAVSELGPCDVYISSWALKEDPARILLSLKESGRIRNLYGVFDYRIKTLDAKHFHLIEAAMTKYRLTKNHAKVVIVRGEKGSMCVVSSANLSNNPRIEAGFISTCTPTVMFHQSWMDAVLSGKNVY